MKTSIALFLILSLIACDDEKDTDPPIPPGCVRVGTVCQNGKSTTDIGPDACKDGGGFKEWICDK